MSWWCKDCRISIPSNPSAPCPQCGKDGYGRQEACRCKKPAIVTDDSYCFRCHRPTPKYVKSKETK